MFLQRQFQVENEDGFVYNIRRSNADDSILVCSYVDHPTLGTGEVAFTQIVVRNRMASGRWKLIASKEDSFQQRVDFFQVHIDAVEENLKSLKDAFQILKNSVVK